MLIGMRTLAQTILCLCLATGSAMAQDWLQPVRGSWAEPDDVAKAGDVVLAGPGVACEIIVARDEHSAVQQAARFLAADIEKLTGVKPAILPRASGRGRAIHLVTLAAAHQVPASIDRRRLQGKWEAYDIHTVGSAAWLVGAGFRGTAFAAYTLSERLGIDPLYIWTGYTPARHTVLILRSTNFHADPPTFKYRGFFHDDEDILPRPFDENGYPLQTGTVPRVWYERFFETALRLRMNMVAPYVRVQRPFEIQKLASDWGLVYTSHHYDTLVSNPWGFTRFGLAAARHAGTEWDWFNNRNGLLNYWRGGVLENRQLDVYWPVGLRGTQDRSYTFPEGTTEAVKNTAYRDAIDAQVRMVKQLLPPGKTPLFHFTLYTEMLPQYQSGKLDVPPGVTIVWTDDNDGHMRALPEKKDQWKHGVYYHLAYFSTTTRLTKQISHLITPMRVEEEFRRIVASGATEYMLVNVSELREYVMEARMLAEITWDAKTAFARPDAGNRYVQWWSKEYFGSQAAEDVAQAYHGYYQRLPSWDQIAVGASAVADALTRLGSKAAGQTSAAPDANVVTALDQRSAAYDALLKTVDTASGKLGAEQRQYFYEHVAFPLLVDDRQTKAAIKLYRALGEADAAAAKRWALLALGDLTQLEDDIRRAERPPFENWYRKTWIRNDDSPYNVHRSYQRTLAFLVANYLKP
jgi:hypothetical protein